MLTDDKIFLNNPLMQTQYMRVPLHFGGLAAAWLSPLQWRVAMYHFISENPLCWYQIWCNLEKILQIFVE